MEVLKRIKFSSLRIYFFYLFLFSIPFQTRKVFLTPYSFHSGAFTEYATVFVYASDIFLALALLAWLISAKKQILPASFYEGEEYGFSSISRKVLSTGKQAKENITKLPKVWLFLFVFIAWLIIDTAINNTYLEISAFQVLKFIEFSLLITFVYFNLRSKKKLITSIFIVSLAGFSQGLIAIFQFTSQNSVFNSPTLHKITGEAIIGPNIAGVAKMLMDSQKVIRAYGTLPHPNVLGGFLILSTLATIYLLLEHRYMFLSSSSKNGLYRNTKYRKSQEYLISLVWIILIFVQIAGLFLTFSRIAWTGFLISIILLLFLYFKHIKIVSRETIYCPELQNHTIFLKNFLLNKENILKFKELLIVFILVIALIASHFSLISARIGENLANSETRLPSNYAITDRTFYNNVSRETISENFIFGSGIGTFIFQINDYLAENEIHKTLEPWQYQPAHNIYFLIASEIGIVGLLIFLLFIAYVAKYALKWISCALGKIRELANKKIVSRETIIEVNSKGVARIIYTSDIRSKNVSRETIDQNSSLDKGRLGGVSKNRAESFLQIKNVSRETILGVPVELVKLNYYLLAIFASFLFIGLFDHYFWTLQQGRLIFWLVLGLLMVNSKRVNKTLLKIAKLLILVLLVL